MRKMHGQTTLKSVPFTSCPTSQNKREAAGNLLFILYVLNDETQEHLFVSVHRIHELLGVYAVYICVLSVRAEKQLLGEAPTPLWSVCRT